MKLINFTGKCRTNMIIGDSIINRENVELRPRFQVKLFKQENFTLDLG